MSILLVISENSWRLVLVFIPKGNSVFAKILLDGYVRWWYERKKWWYYTNSFNPKSKINGKENKNEKKIKIKTKSIIFNSGIFVTTLS